MDRIGNCIDGVVQSGLSQEGKQDTTSVSLEVKVQQNNRREAWTNMRNIRGYGLDCVHPALVPFTSPLLQFQLLFLLHHLLNVVNPPPLQMILCPRLQEDCAAQLAESSNRQSPGGQWENIIPLPKAEAPAGVYDW